MYIAVIPFSHTLSIEPYTYFVPENWQTAIVVGCLVEVPFGKSIEQGIVASISASQIGGDYDETMKSIISVVASLPLLAPYQISMLLHISHRYFLPVHRVLQLFLPRPLMTRLDKKNYILDAPSQFQSFPVDEGVRGTIEYYKTHALSQEDIEKRLHPGSVFIFPDDFFLSSFVHSLSSSLLSSFSDSTPVQKSKFWIQVYEGKEPIIAGTRRLLYYNLSQYSHVYYIEDAFGDEDYQYPSRIRNLDILQALSDQNQMRITILTSSPTLDIFAKFRNYKVITV